MRLGWSVIGVLALDALLLCGPVSAAQKFHYIGRATAAALTGAPSGDVGAGGKDAKGNVIEDMTCDARDVKCFDQSATAGVIPGLVLTGTARTFGGAQKADGTPNPGFPRTESTAQASLVSLDPALSIAVAPTKAIADSFTGELTAVGGPVLVELGGSQITIPAGEGIMLGNLGTLLAAKTTKFEKNGLSLVEIDGAIFDPDPKGPLAALGPVILGRAIAGVEIPFAEGGGGSGGCSLASNGESRPGFWLLGILGLLGVIALGRRRAG